uniref:Uncharacterized protein n=1 Tax=Oryza glumipatula TaxID=40148 RepID=A0A0E0BIZ7_9ORYZ
MCGALEGGNVEGEESRDVAGDGEGMSAARGAEEFEAKMRAPREERQSNEKKCPSFVAMGMSSSRSRRSNFVIVLVIYRQESNQIKEKPTQSPGCRLTIWTGMLLLSAVIRGGRRIIAGDFAPPSNLLPKMPIGPAGSEIDVHDPDADLGDARRATEFGCCRSMMVWRLLGGALIRGEERRFFFSFDRTLI